MPYFYSVGMIIFPSPLHDSDLFGPNGIEWYCYGLFWDLQNEENP